MTETIVPLASLTLSASNKTITLAAPYATIPIEKIKEIRNLTRSQLIYSSEIPSANTITLALGVITFSYPGTMEDGDAIQLTIDSSNLATPLLSTLLNAVVLAGGASSDNSAALPVYGASSLMLTMIKTGTSTSASFTVYTSHDGTNIDTDAFQTFTISGAGAKQLTRPVTVGAAYIIVKATNGDGVNSATVTAKVVSVFGSCAYR